MRLRLKLLRIILRNCKPLFFIPIIIAYCLLPGVSAFKYFYVDPSEARNTFIYMSQVFIPLCGLLWPMGYLHVWVEGDGCEALRACTKYHKTCVGELLLLCSAYLLMVFPTIAFAVIMFHLSWLEYMRLALQFSIIINFLYFMIMLLKNVTIGCIPVVAYLLLCFYISGSADFAVIFDYRAEFARRIFKLEHLACGFSSSLLGLLLGYLLDRFWYKYL